MRSTLFYIPHEILGLPLLGVGWLLLVLIIGCVIWSIQQARLGRLGSELSGALPVWLIAAALIIFVLPQIESHWPDGQPVGLPVRGYGILVLLGLFSGIGLTVWRGKQVGLGAEQIVSLGFWMMLGGVVGARLFFVVQYWETFDSMPLGTRLLSIVKLTEGGLVIYGGMLGGAVAGGLFCWRYGQPMFATADLIAPGFLIGLAFGRIGCLLNGCCFGGMCTAELPTIQFPQGSPPYVAQVENGQLFGLKLDEQHGWPPRILTVEPDSIAATDFSAEPGMIYEQSNRSLPPQPDIDDPARTHALTANVGIGDKERFFTPEELPKWSRPVHPSQIYSAVDAGLLCMLILCIQPWVFRDGQAFLLAIVLHGIARFTLEFIRSDEAGQFGTVLTISQWISLVGGLSALALLLYSLSLPRRRAWTFQPTGA